MTQDMSNKMNIEENIFPHWGKNIPTLGKKYSSTSEAAKPSAQPGKKTGLRLTPDDITARRQRDYGSCPTRLRLVITLFLMLVVGVNVSWGQTDYSGTYYIASEVD